MHRPLIFSAMILIFLCSMLFSCVPNNLVRLNIPGLQPETARSLFLDGCRLYAKDELGAIKKFEAAYAKDNNSMEALTAIAFSYLILASTENEKKIAAEYYKKSAYYSNIIISKDKNNGDGYLLLSIISGINEDFENGIKYSKRLIDIKPGKKFMVYGNEMQRVFEYHGLAVNYGSLGDYQNCLHYLKIFLAKAGNGKEYVPLVASAKELIPLVEKEIQKEKQKAAQASRPQQPSPPEAKRNVASAGNASNPATRNAVPETPAGAKPRQPAKQAREADAQSPAAPATGAPQTGSSGTRAPVSPKPAPKFQRPSGQGTSNVAPSIASSPPAQPPEAIAASININEDAIGRRSPDSLLQARLAQKILIASLKSYL